MQGKVVLITAGAKRVGAAICRKLHLHGASLMVHYRSSLEEAQWLETELNQIRPGSVALVRADLLDISQIPRLISQTIQKFGKLDALINNASSFFPTPVGAVTEAGWDDLIGSNLKAPLFLSQEAAPHLKNQFGCIVNIIDIHADRPLKNYVIYSSAKAGLSSLTRSLALELAPEIRVNGVSPGPILWPENDEWKDLSVRQSIISKTLLKRMGEPDDIARTVLFLIADAPYVTGQIIVVDGGRSVNL
ncbi:MAG: Glucose 1-dehydrogenase 1 [Nitrosomonadaceae bacterium]|nr:pteridine reductase [Nitrosospira sp.]MBI0413718.1 pteridine reductase [Nitrosospira sp.]MCG3771632.1 Glucose 1-dehydrogenase 1 [Nitrosomonadaceae bacterium]MSQ45032.1 pteridine reductase [Nitrosomonadaceae bacterium]GDX59222.1 pteridine reductase [Nitrosomonadaceae bacterium]